MKFIRVIFAIFTLFVVGNQAFFLNGGQASGSANFHGLLNHPWIGGKKETSEQTQIATGQSVQGSGQSYAVETNSISGSSSSSSSGSSSSSSLLSGGALGGLLSFGSSSGGIPDVRKIAGYFSNF
jgi:hypothetical protein